MKKSIWGPCVWNTLHVFSVKIKESCFATEKKELFKIIHNICANLPCPQCSSHAVSMLKKYRINNIQTKEQLIKMLFNMHNEVNKRTKKPPYDYDKIVPTYSKYKTQTVLNEYYFKMSNARYGEKMMLYSFKRNRFVDIYKRYCVSHIKCFDE